MCFAPALRTPCSMRRKTAKFDCGLFVRNSGVRVQSEDGAPYTIREFQTEPFKDGWVIYCLVPFRPADEAPVTKR